MDIKKLLYTAIQASLKAGDEILKIYDSKFDIEFKEDKSPVTLADKNAHESICETLKVTQLPVLSEEGDSIEYAERCAWEYFWMVDPLDGTKEFIKHNGEFTVNIALINNQKSILGVIYVPVTQTLYFAADGIGSYKLNMQLLKSKIHHPISVTELDEIIKISDRLPLITENRGTFTIIASRSHLSEETEMFIDGLKTVHKKIDFISSGSSIKLCLVAEGRADVYPRFAPTMEWDTAAGQAICENSGKTVIDYVTNQTLLYNKPNLLNHWFIVQ